jgi:hypothetical protein
MAKPAAFFFTPPSIPQNLTKTGRWSLLDPMRQAAAVAAVLVLVACGAGGQEAPPASSTPEPSTASPAQSSTRPLTSAECQSLLQRITAACEAISGTHSAQIDAYCTDIRGRGSDGTWVSDECVKHFRYVDYMCFSTNDTIGPLMDCDHGVERSGGSEPPAQQ